VRKFLVILLQYQLQKSKTKKRRPVGIQKKYANLPHSGFPDNTNMRLNSPGLEVKRYCAGRCPKGFSVKNPRENISNSGKFI
jgi:hypothetical protein